MFLPLIEEVRLAVEGSGSRYSKSDRQDAFLKKFRGQRGSPSKKDLRRRAMHKHGGYDHPDAVFRQDTEQGTPTKPGHGAALDKARHAIFNRQFKYSKKHKRDVIGPSGKIPK